MTLAGDCGWAAVRGVGIALAAVVAAGGARALIGSAPRRLGRVLWAIHLVPWLTPVLLVGYAYSRLSLSLIREPALNQAFYTALVWLRLTPVATLALYFAPTPIAPEALHCHRLLGPGGRRTPWAALALWARGPGRAVGVAFAAVFLLAFGEFEMASLLGIRSWTVALFDAQIGGLALGASLRLALPALACQAALVFLVLGILAATPHRARNPRGRRSAPSRPVRALVWGHLAVALVGVTLLPAAVVLRGAVEGLRLLGEALTLLREIGASAAFALVGAGAAYLVAGAALRRARRARNVRRMLAGTFALCVPGLLGSLLLGLLLLACFQLPLLRPLYDTPLPLMAALALLLLPFALLLRSLVAVSRRPEATHAASMLEISSSRPVARRARRTVWELGDRRLFWIGFLLFVWGYCDLSASALLAPSQMTPVLVRLYNFMHYGHTMVLSAMVCLAFAVPVVALLLARPAYQWLARSHG